MERDVKARDTVCLWRREGSRILSGLSTGVCVRMLAILVGLLNAASEVLGAVSISLRRILKTD